MCPGSHGDSDYKGIGMWSSETSVQSWRVILLFIWKDVHSGSTKREMCDSVHNSESENASCKDVGISMAVDVDRFSLQLRL